MSERAHTVVIVDDSAAVRIFFEKVATAIDVELKTYPSAAAALEYLGTQQPSLLFLDIIMPDKDGLTFLQELRRLPLHQNTTTIVISSKDYAQDRNTARQLGVVEFVAKPMTTRVIEDLIVKYTGARLRSADTRS
ncbi:MAG: response regulator [Gammaproteobacteria bacterium]|nr:response regulator [Gammaproteobacteria bacterium]